ncbi:MAG TPA: hypothetical protein VM554_02700 [Acidisarcina sp.]|nr:hypothetical protein [Acidisarcina sp.]
MSKNVELDLNCPQCEKTSANEKISQRASTHASKVDKLARVVDALRAKGHVIPSRVSEIPEFPCQTFDDLRSKLSKRELMLYRPGINYSSEVFTLVATQGESALFNLSMVVMYVLPVITIVLSLFVRWPWILASPVLVYMGWKMGRSTYMGAIFRSAAASEMNFCFLFYGYKVGLILPDGSKPCVWNGPSKVEK